MKKLLQFVILSGISFLRDLVYKKKKIAITRTVFLGLIFVLFLLQIKKKIKNLGYEVTGGPSSNILEGESICITGRLVQHKNRDELVKRITDRGGKVVSGVSKNTTWLINNDVNSTSSKNVTAQKLGIPIITEEEFINQFLSMEI